MDDEKNIQVVVKKEDIVFEDYHRNIEIQKNGTRIIQFSREKALKEILNLTGKFTYGYIYDEFKKCEDEYDIKNNLTQHKIVEHELLKYLNNSTYPVVNFSKQHTPETLVSSEQWKMTTEFFKYNKPNYYNRFNIDTNVTLTSHINCLWKDSLDDYNKAYNLQKNQANLNNVREVAFREIEKDCSELNLPLGYNHKENIDNKNYEERYLKNLWNRLDSEETLLNENTSDIKSNFLYRRIMKNEIIEFIGFFVNNNKTSKSYLVYNLDDKNLKENFIKNFYDSNIIVLADENKSLEDTLKEIKNIWPTIHDFFKKLEFDGKEYNVSELDDMIYRFHNRRIQNLIEEEFKKCKRFLKGMIYAKKSTFEDNIDDEDYKHKDEVRNTLSHEQIQITEYNREFKFKQKGMVYKYPVDIEAIEEIYNVNKLIKLRESNTELLQSNELLLQNENKVNKVNDQAIKFFSKKHFVPFQSIKYTLPSKYEDDEILYQDFYKASSNSLLQNYDPIRSREMQNQTLEANKENIDNFDNNVKQRIQNFFRFLNKHNIPASVQQLKDNSDPINAFVKLHRSKKEKTEDQKYLKYYKNFAYILFYVHMKGRTPHLQESLRKFYNLDSERFFKDVKEYNEQDIETYVDTILKKYSEKKDKSLLKYYSYLIQFENGYENISDETDQFNISIIHMKGILKYLYTILSKSMQLLQLIKAHDPKKIPKEEKIKNRFKPFQKDIDSIELVKQREYNVNRTNEMLSKANYNVDFKHKSDDKPFENTKMIEDDANNSFKKIDIETIDSTTSKIFDTEKYNNVSNFDTISTLDNSELAFYNKIHDLKMNLIDIPFQRMLTYNFNVPIADFVYNDRNELYKQLHQILLEFYDEDSIVENLEVIKTQFLKYTLFNLKIFFQSNREKKEEKTSKFISILYDSITKMISSIKNEFESDEIRDKIISQVSNYFISKVNKMIDNIKDQNEYNNKVFNKKLYDNLVDNSRKEKLRIKNDLSPDMLSIYNNLRQIGLEAQIDADKLTVSSEQVFDEEATEDLSFDNGDGDGDETLDDVND